MFERIAEIPGLDLISKHLPLLIQIIANQIK